MTKYPMLRTKGDRFLFGLVLLVMLLLARDTLVSSCILGFEKSQYAMLAFMIAYGVCFLLENKKNWRALLTDRRWYLIFLSAALFLIPMLAKRDWQMMYFSMLICLFFAIFVSFFADIQDTARMYVRLLAVLGAYSVAATYVFKELAAWGLLHPTVFYNSNGWDFYNFGLAYVVTWDAWIRNFGIFREPGVYQFFLLLALYLNNYHTNWDSSRRTWGINLVLAVTMVTTFAVGGILELALFALFLYFDKGAFRCKTGRILGLIGAILCAAAASFLFWKIHQPGIENTIYYELYDMWLRLTTKSDSLMDRLSAIWVNLQLFLGRPLTGDTIANVLHGTAHNTSSTLILFATLGVFGGCFHVLCWVCLVWEKRRGVLGNLVLLGILFLSFNTQNLVADVFFWLFPVMAVVRRGILERGEHLWKKKF